MRKTGLVLAACLFCASTIAEGARLRFAFAGTVAADQPWDLGSDDYKVGDRFYAAVIVDASTDVDPSANVVTYNVLEAIVLVRGTSIKYFHWFEQAELAYHTVRFEETSVGTTHWDIVTAHIGTLSQDWLLTSTNTPAGTAFNLADPLFWDVTVGDFNTFTWREARGYSSAEFSPIIMCADDVERGDFTADLKGSVLWRHATNGEVWLWPMHGAARTGENYVRTVPDTNWEIRSLGDHTGGGKADILWRHKTTGTLYLWEMDGATLVAETYVGTVDPAYDIVATGDYNHDGRCDLLWRHLGNGEVWMWLMNGATPLAETFLTTVDPAYAVVGSGDLNGDSKADIVWQHRTVGEVWVWLMDGAARLSETWVATVPDVGYQIVGLSDFTGDGKADILWHHQVNGEVWLWTMIGAVREAETWVGNVPDTDYRVVADGDYNGDGKADILWHHATAGEVWVWLMDGAMPLSQAWAGTVSDVGYRPVPILTTQPPYTFTGPIEYDIESAPYGLTATGIIDGSIGSTAFSGLWIFACVQDEFGFWSCPPFGALPNAPDHTFRLATNVTIPLSRVGGHVSGSGGDADIAMMFNGTIAGGALSGSVTWNMLSLSLSDTVSWPIR